MIRRRWAAITIGVSALLFFSCAAARMLGENAGKVLETFTVGAFQYRVAVAPCVRGTCPVTVDLLKNGRRVDRKTLPQAAATGDFERQPIDPAWTGWLSGKEPQLRVWNSGYENGYLGVLARPVRLGWPEMAHTGLLATQLSGFDHLHRDHVLYVIDRGRLKKAWSFSESGYPMSSAVFPVMTGKDHFLLFRQEWSGFPQSDEEPDWQRIYLLSWRAEGKKIDAVQLPTEEFPLYAVVAGFHPNVPSAREAAKRMKCAEGVDLRVLATEHYPQLAGNGVSNGKALLGNLFFTREEARKYRDELKRCTPATDAETIPLSVGSAREWESGAALR